MMALFKEKLCAHCGKRAGMLTRYDLADGKRLCFKCATELPFMMVDQLSSRTYPEFRRAYHYIKEVNPELEKRFVRTYKYGSLQIDTNNDLFCLDHEYPKLYIPLDQITEFNLQFRITDEKEGFLGGKVYGDVYLRLQVESIKLYFDKKIDSFVKGVGEARLPKGMEEFLFHFYGAMKRIQGKQTRRPDNHHYNSHGNDEEYIDYGDDDDEPFEYTAPEHSKPEQNSGSGKKKSSKKGRGKKNSGDMRM